MNYISIEGRQQFQLAMTVAAAQTAALKPGVYDVVADVDCFIKVAKVANDVTTLTGYPLLANNQVPIEVKPDSKIGAILAAGTGTLKIHQVQ